MDIAMAGGVSRWREGCRDGRQGVAMTIGGSVVTIYGHARLLSLERIGDRDTARTVSEDRRAELGR